ARTIGLGIPLPEVMLMSNPTMTIPIQRDPRLAAGPRVTFFLRREPTVELSPSRDQLYCALSGLSRHYPCSARRLWAADHRSSGRTVLPPASRGAAPATRLAARPVRLVLGNDSNRRPAL